MPILSKDTPESKIDLKELHMFLQKEYIRTAKEEIDSLNELLNESITKVSDKHFPGSKDFPSKKNEIAEMKLCQLINFENLLSIGIPENKARSIVFDLDDVEIKDINLMVDTTKDSVKNIEKYLKNNEKRLDFFEKVIYTGASLIFSGIIYIIFLK